MCIVVESQVESIGAELAGVVHVVLRYSHGLEFSWDQIQIQDPSRRYRNAPSLSLLVDITV